MIQSKEYDSSIPPKIITSDNPLIVLLSPPNITFLFPTEIEELSDRVVVLKDGKVERETYVDEIQKEFGSVASYVEGL